MSSQASRTKISDVGTGSTHDESVRPLLASQGPTAVRRLVEQQLAPLPNEWDIKTSRALHHVALLLQPVIMGSWLASEFSADSSPTHSRAQGVLQFALWSLTISTMLSFFLSFASAVKAAAKNLRFNPPVPLPENYPALLYSTVGFLGVCFGAVGFATKANFAAPVFCLGLASFVWANVLRYYYLDILDARIKAGRTQLTAPVLGLGLGNNGMVRLMRDGGKYNDQLAMASMAQAFMCAVAVPGLLVYQYAGSELERSVPQAALLVMAITVLPCSLVSSGLLWRAPAAPSSEVTEVESGIGPFKFSFR